MKIKAVIFDLDGTITEPYLDFDKIRTEIGLSPDSEPILESMAKMSPAQRQKTEEILYKHEQQAVEHSTLNKGAAQIFDWLKKNNIPVGILTRNTRHNASAVAKKHNLEFNAIFDRNDGPPKPDPFGIKKLCKFFNVQPQQTLVVGDYLYDLQSAKAAGATAILVRAGKNVEKFGSEADYVIDSLAEIIDIINSSQ
jgi:HAD superfamily hydrolase (TIGR01509 family)